MKLSLCIEDFNIFLNRFEKLLNKLDCDKRIIINSDFKSFTADVKYSKIADLVSYFNFKPINQSSTRNKNCIDNILMNFNHEYINSTFDPDLSDHRAITTSFVMSVCVPQVHLQQIFLVESYIKSCKEIECVGWDYVNDKYIN